MYTYIHAHVYVCTYETVDLGGEEDEAVADEAQQPEAEQHPGRVRQLFGVYDKRDVLPTRSIENTGKHMHTHTHTCIRSKHTYTHLHDPRLRLEQRQAEEPAGGRQHARRDKGTRGDTTLRNAAT